MVEFPIGSKVRVIKTSGFSHTEYNYEKYNVLSIGDVCEVLSYRCTQLGQLDPDGSYKFVEILRPNGISMGCHVECFAKLVTDDFEETGEE